MPNFGMAEQYGTPCSDSSQPSKDIRAKKWCSFLHRECVKSGGVCSLTDGTTVTIVCPHRFREGALAYEAIARKAFGTTKDCLAVNEVPFLEDSAGKAVGNIDNLIIRRIAGRIDDWCAVEVQAVYFSGKSMESEIRKFETTGVVPSAASRRPDFRSCGTKRLLPQLEVKVPTLRRWGKKMFVVIDEPFFGWMPKMLEANDLSNADICWTVMSLDASASPYKLQLSQTVMTTLEEASVALVGGKAMALPDFETKVQGKVADGRSKVWEATDSN